MDYVVGSVAALITGNVTPSRPRLLKRALTPTKHQPSPNVTPKSEFVEDRSIFLSPTMQKKKAIVKKSPKRIFQNPDLETIENGEGNASLSSPRADKVKKHLRDDLEGDSNANISITSLKSPKNKVNNKRESISTQEIDKSVNEQNVNESTPKKKKKKDNSESKDLEPVADADVMMGDARTTAKSPKNKKQRRKSVVDIDSNKENDSSDKVNKPEIANIDRNPKNQNNTLNNSDTPKNTNVVSETSNNTTPKKKNRKRKKKSKAQATTAESSENKDSVTGETNKINIAEETNKETLQKENQLTPKKKNKKRRKPKKGLQSKPEMMETDEQSPLETQNKIDIESTKSKGTDDPNNVSEEANKATVSEETKKENQVTPKKKKQKKSKGSEIMETDETRPVDTQNATKIYTSKTSSTVNPNAVTNKESDSEHESDNEIESENEEINKKVLEAEKPAESSDDEEDETEKVDKKVTEKKEGSRVERSTEEEVKRTLFVGNVLFTPKCKKEIKKIFSKHGQIETIRIRTVPIKDGRYTPKLAVIKNELHPERTTVNVYIKYADEDSVEKALIENNTVLNDNHLRVSRSSSTGAEHDPRCSVFIGNLPFAMEDEALRARFEKCGEIHSVRIIRDKKTNAGKGFGYVNFESKDGVELALALTEEDLTVKNRILRVKRCTQVTNKKRPVQTGNNQNIQQRGGFRGGNNQGNQLRGNFRTGNQDRGNFRSGNQERGDFRSGNNQVNHQRGSSSQGNRQRSGFGNNNNHNGGFNKFGSQRNQPQKDEEGREGAHRRVMNKRKYQDGAAGDAPPNKRPKDTDQPNKEKKIRKEFVGMTAEKKKKRKFDKGQKKKKTLSEILTK